MPKGVAERAEEERREIKAGPYDSAGRRETAGRERWELGSAIGDGWEALFTEVRRAWSFLFVCRGVEEGVMHLIVEAIDEYFIVAVCQMFTVGGRG